MTGISQLLRTHIDYTIWASNRLLEAGTELEPAELQRDFETADKSIQGTLLHLMRAEQNWLRRIEKDTPDVTSTLPPVDPWGLVKAQWPQVHQNWQIWASQLSDIEAESTVEYTDTKGTHWNNPVWQIVFHVVNHSTHHRGQVSGFLRAMGKTPPPLDLIAFLREQP